MLGHRRMGGARGNAGGEEAIMRNEDTINHESITKMRGNTVVPNDGKEEGGAEREGQEAWTTINQEKEKEDTNGWR